MKYFILIAVFSTLLSGLFAQTDDELGKISLSVIMPEYFDGLDVTQLSRLQTKITQIVTGSGLAASGIDQNFVIYPTFVIAESSTVESGMKDLTIINCELSLFIKDYENNIIFSSVTKTLKGSGKSKNQAVTSALSKINVNDPDFKSFITLGKNRIVEYFNTKCDFIIQNAFALAKQERFDEAIYNLISVPEVCDECYFRCLDTLEVIYALKINADCRYNLVQAKIIWASTQTSEGAEKVVSLISAINPFADCQGDVDKFIKEINEKLRSDQDADWQFKMKQYQDSVAAQRARWDFEVKKYFDEADRNRNGSTVEINVNSAKSHSGKVSPPNSNQNTGNANHKTGNPGTTNISGSKIENESNQLSYKERKAKKRNQNLDNLWVKEYRNVGIAYAQNKPKSMNYELVSRN
jgi:hypothetical protein